MITIQEIESIFKTDTGRIRNLAFTHGAVSKIALEVGTKPIPKNLRPTQCHRNTRRSHFILNDPRGDTLYNLIAQSIVIAFEQERVRQGN